MSTIEAKQQYSDWRVKGGWGEGLFGSEAIEDLQLSMTGGDTSRRWAIYTCLNVANPNYPNLKHISFLQPKCLSRLHSPLPQLMILFFQQQDTNGIGRNLFLWGYTTRATHGLLHKGIVHEQPAPLVLLLKMLSNFTDLSLKLRYLLHKACLLFFWLWEFNLWNHYKCDHCQMLRNTPCVYFSSFLTSSSHSFPCSWVHSFWILSISAPRASRLVIAFWSCSCRPLHSWSSSSSRPSRLDCFPCNNYRIVRRGWNIERRGEERREGEGEREEKIWEHM